MTFVETFVGKGIRPRKLRKIGYISSIYGLLIFLTVQMFYIPLVWRAHWTGEGELDKEAEVEIINQANAQHPEASLFLKISFLLLAVGALIALKNRYYDYAGTKLQIVYLFMVVWTFYLFIAHPPDGPIFATNAILYGRLSPGVLFLMPFLLLSANPRMWPFFQQFLVYMCWYATVMGVLGFILMGEASREAAYRWLWVPGLMLEMTALFPIILIRSKKLIFKVAAVFPLLILTLINLFQQTRGGFVILAVFAVVYVLMRRDDDSQKNNRSRRIMLSILATSLAGIVFLVMPEVGNEGAIGGSYNAFMGRLDQDTRSSQWVNLFETLDENKGVYLWGRGHINDTEAYDFGGGGARGVDSGYMNILWVGGLPLLLAYIMFSTFGVIQAFFRRLNISDILVVALSMGFIVRMISSTTAGFQIQYLLFLVLLGRIIFITNNGKKRKRGRRKRSLVRSTVG